MLSFYLLIQCFWRFSLFLSRLCCFYSFFSMQRVFFNISCRAGLLAMNFSFCLPGKLFICPSILNDSLAGTTILECIFFPFSMLNAKFLWRDLLLTLFVFPCGLEISFPLLLSRFFFFTYLCILEILVSHVLVLDCFCWFWWEFYVLPGFGCLLPSPN